MTDVRELVGEEGSLEELARLQRVHDLLVAARPPLELSPRSWRLRLLAVSFGVRYLTGSREGEMPTNRRLGRTRKSVGDR